MPESSRLRGAIHAHTHTKPRLGRTSVRHHIPPQKRRDVTISPYGTQGLKINKLMLHCIYIIERFCLQEPAAHGRRTHGGDPPRKLPTYGDRVRRACRRGGRAHGRCRFRAARAYVPSRPPCWSTPRTPAPSPASAARGRRFPDASRHTQARARQTCRRFPQARGRWHGSASTRSSP